MRYLLELAHDPDSPAAARRALGDLADHLPPRRLQDAQLLVSELVTNAIRHAGLHDGDTITLSVEASDRALRIEVSDPGPGFAPAEPEPDHGTCPAGASTSCASCRTAGGSSTTRSRASGSSSTAPPRTRPAPSCATTSRRASSRRRRRP